MSDTKKYPGMKPDSWATYWQKVKSEFDTFQSEIANAQRVLRRLYKAERELIDPDDPELANPKTE